MRKVKKLSNKLIAILLSASMVFAPALQSIPVYAAEPVIEEGSAGTLSDNAVTDEPTADNNDSDTPDADNGDSDNPGTENGDSGNHGTEDGDTENPEEPDAEDGDSENSGDATVDESLVWGGVLLDAAFEAEGVQAAAAVDRGTKVVNVSDFASVGGWNESIYAEIAGIDATDVVEVEYSGPSSGKLSAHKVHASDTETDLDYLVRKIGSNVRIDIPGLKAGAYTLKVTLGSNTKVLEKTGIKVYGYDRSGYAHFNYTSGVGAYNDDGTLKDNAVVLYVTDENKNTVELTVGSKTVKGIGNILNSAGAVSKEGSTTNSNGGIIKELAKADKPLVVRFIGTVSESGLYSKDTWSASYDGLIEGLTDFDSLDNGGSVGDNGHMARIQSGKDITLEGIGTDAVIDGWGFHYIAEGSAKEYGKSFEVRNLTFINTAEDAVGMEGQQEGNAITSGVERCWVHNNEFYCPHISDPAEDDKAEGDGSMDFKRGNYLTCSYNYFEGCHKTNLVGASSTTYQYNLTYHHNYYYKCGSRGPLSRNANIHMYNNVYEQQTDYAMDARASAYIFAEYNLFYAANSPHTTYREGGGTIKSYKDSFSSVSWNNGKGDIVDDKTTYVENNCQYAAGNIKYDKFDLDSAQSYIPDGNYELQTDFMKMRAVLASQLGVQDGNPIPIAEITPDDYSMVRKSGVSIPQIELPFSAEHVTISQTTYAFKVDVPFNISVEYGSVKGILVNDAGENLLEGSGERTNLPAGRYMIQPASFNPFETGSNIWGTCNIDSINIEANDTGIVIKPGDHVLNFDGMKKVDPDNFFTVTGDYTNTMGSAVVEGKGYNDGLKMNSGANVTFSCNDVATLTLIFDTESGGKTVKVDGQEYEITADGIVLRGLSAGSHSITKGDTELALFYVVVSEGEAKVNSYTVTLDYNDDSSSDAKKLVLDENTKYETMSELVPSTFTKEGYVLEGLYTDAECNTKVVFPYIVTKNVTLYANWNAVQKVTHSLDCSKDLDDAVDDTETDTKGNIFDTITTRKTINGFTLHVLPDGEGSTKYYMTLKNSSTDNVKVLFTNGVLIKTDQDPVLKAIEFETSANSVLIVETALSGNPESGKTYKLVLAKDGAAAGSEQKHNLTQGKTKVTETFNIDEAGKYYLYPEGDKGLVYYSLKVTEPQYTIVYEPGGKAASGDFTSVVAIANEEIALPACEAVEGYTFTGWSLDGTTPIDGDKYIVKSTDAVNGKITLKAVYEKDEVKPVVYTIKFDGNGGSLPSDLQSDRLLEAGAKIDLSAYKPTSEGKRFVGWQINDVDLEDSVYTVKAADADENNTITIKAVYEKDKEEPSRKGIYIIGLEEEYQYTGAKIIPDIGVMDYNIGTGKLLTPGVDYTVKYKNNVKAADKDKVDKKKIPTVTVTGKGNYANMKVEKTFSIIDVTGAESLENLTGAKIDAIAPMPYTGEPQYPAAINLKLKSQTKAVTYTYSDDGKYKDSDGAEIPANVAISNNVNKGTATILLTGKAPEGKTKPTTLKKTFRITAIDLKANEGKIEVVEGLDNVTYAVKGAAPKSITVTLDGQKLKNGTDYTVKYSSNKKAGKDIAKVTITGKGNYTKNITKTYSIAKLNMSELKVDAVKAYAGLKPSKVTATVLDKDGNTLKPSQYTLAVYKDKNKTPFTTATEKLEEKTKIYVEAVAKDTVNLVEGSKAAAEFDVGINIAGAKFVLKKVNNKTICKEYTGKAIELDKKNDFSEAKIKVDGKWKDLDPETDYEITGYSNNVNKGTATAIIVGKGDYSGTKTVRFTIAGQKVGDFTGGLNWDDIRNDIKGFMNGIFQFDY